MATFKSAVNQSIGTSDVSVLTAIGQTTVIGMSIANTLTSSITIDVKYTKGATTVYIVKAAPIAPGGSLIVFGGEQKLVLETGNVLKVRSSSASSVDTVTSYLEI